MAATIESFVGRTDPAPVSQFVGIGGEQIFRTTYPSIARERSCVDCHNKLQPDLHWQLNDVMGAFSIDAPVGEFVHDLRWQSTAIALAVFVLIAGIGLWMSLSHYRRIREREAAREQAVAANEAGASFLANISHQLHTPLKAIIRFSEMMLSEMLGPLPNDKYRACVADIHRNGSHLLGVINDILDLSQAGAGKLQLDESVFDPHDLLRSIARRMTDRLKTAGVTLNMNLPPELPLLRADQLKIRRVLSHLVIKAIKFTPAGGAVELICRVERESGLAITVADTGAGMSPERMSRVLDALEQMRAPKPGSQQGSGLGLPLVKAIMELHGGNLELTSAENAGTRATVTFPPDRLVFDALRPAA
jgi:signal transduction histidine kinase